MKLISDIDLENLVKNEIEETEKSMKHLTKIAGIPKRNVRLGKLKSKQLEDYNNKIKKL